MQQIERWSFSRLGNKGCPLLCKLKYVDRIKEPDRGPPPAGLTEWPNERGTRLHSEAENCVRGDQEFTQELVPFKPEILVLRKMHDAGIVQLENPWTFDREWAEAGPYKEFEWWCAIIIDAFVRLSVEEALAIDYKSGKRAWNEIKHAEQMKFYAMGTFLKFPEVQQVTTELWYLDEGLLIQHVHRRNRIATTVRSYTNIGNVFTRPRAAWPAKPSRQTCFFCAYKTGLIGKHGPEGLGLCDRNLEL